MSAGEDFIDQVFKGIDDYSDWQKYVKSKQQERAARVTERQLHFLAQAEVAAQHLTSDPHWNAFLQTVQGMINAQEQVLESVVQSFTSGGNPSDEELIGMHRMAAGATAKLEVLNEVIEIPSKLKALGKEAKRELRDDEADS